MALTQTQESQLIAMIPAFENGLKIPDMTSATTCDETELIEVSQGGVTKKMTLSLPLGTKALKTRNISAGAGMTGGGDLAEDRTINVVSADDGITVNADNIQLAPVANLTSTSTTKALAASQGKALKDAADIAISDQKAMYPSIAYYKRVLADSGTTLDKNLLSSAYSNYLKQLPETKLLFMPEVGVKERVSGLNKYGIKMYGMDSANTDAVQLTDATQPFMTVNAAPNSRKGLNYLQGQTQTGLVDFPDVSFAAADSWTLTMRVNVNRKGATLLRFGALYINFSSTSVALVQGSTVVLTSPYSLDCGKTYTFEFQYSNGVGLVKKDNVALITTSVGSSVTFSYISTDTVNYLDGTLYALHLTNTRKSETQSQIDHAFLSTIFPEIEGVDIGNQRWATDNFNGTVDGAGNVIVNVTENAAWANSTALFDAAYASASGSVAQKTYAGCKAAAMWCYYNNDPAMGAIYGKLYNWYAVYLIYLNPPKGWRVPAKLDFDQLVAYLGGSTVAGGKMKAKFGGFDNGFASNESGFSAIPAGYRLIDGTFGVNSINAYFPVSEGSHFFYIRNSDLLANNQAITLSDRVRGFPLRLIRNEPTLPNEVSYTTGKFTDNIASTYKPLTISNGYVVKSFRVRSDVNLTNFTVALYSFAGVLSETLVTGKSITAGEVVTLIVTVDQKTQYQDPTLRITATGNTAADFIEVMVNLEKDIVTVN